MAENEPEARSGVPDESRTNRESAPDHIGVPGLRGAAAHQPGHLKRTERIFMRLSVLQSVLAVAGVFTGAVALYAAITESEAVRRQAAAVVWPYVQSTLWTGHEDGSPTFALELANAGVGPAKLRAMRVKLDGHVVRNWGEALALAGVPDVPFDQLVVSRRVLRAGEAATLVKVSGDAPVKAMLRLANAPATTLEYCYCSIYDECWLATVARAPAEPAAVAECPNYGAESFSD
ncbi:MAG: hypothetical protein R3E77_05295 [Steroidobacteraceae bacterium]